MSEGVWTDDEEPAEPQSGDSSTDMPSNVDIINWPDGGPGFSYSKLSSNQKKNLIDVFRNVGQAVGVDWSKVRIHGIVEEPVELVDPDNPDRDDPPLHPNFVQRPVEPFFSERVPAEDVIGDTLIIAPGVAYPTGWHQGQWISVEEDVLVDCEMMESESASKEFR